MTATKSCYAIVIFIGIHFLQNFYQFQRKAVIEHKNETVGLVLGKQFCYLSRRQTIKIFLIIVRRICYVAEFDAQKFPTWPIQWMSVPFSRCRIFLRLPVALR